MENIDKKKNGANNFINFCIMDLYKNETIGDNQRVSSLVYKNFATLGKKKPFFFFC